MKAGRRPPRGHPRGQRLHRGRAEGAAPDDQGHEAVAAGEDEAPAESGGARVGAVAPGRPPVQGRKRALAQRRPEHRDLGGDVDPLAPPRRLALEVRDQRARHRLSGGLQRGLVAADAHGRPVGVADQVHHAGHRLDHDLRALPGAIGPSWPKGVMEVRIRRGFSRCRSPSRGRVPRDGREETIRARCPRLGPSRERGAGRRACRGRGRGFAPRPRRPTRPGQPPARPRRPRTDRGGEEGCRRAARRARRRRRGRPGSCRRGRRGRR